MTQKIVLLAQTLKQKYNTNNVTELCRCLGITLVRADLPKRITGFYMEAKEKQAIVIGASVEAPFDTACIAHELGHALLHKNINTIFLSDSTNFVPGRYEREADLFAAALLIDEEVVRAGSDSIEEISQITGVPSYAVEQFCGASLRV